MDNVTIRALRKELERLRKAEKKAEDEFNECVNIHNELFAIRKEFSDVIKIEPWEKQKPALDDLIKRSKKAEKIMNKDLIKLMDNHSKSRMALSECEQVLRNEEFRLKNRF